jgi:hypothetical protein
MSHLFASTPSKMVFEHFGIVFTQKILWMDSRNCFNFIFILHKVTFPCWNAHVLWVACPLAMTKPLVEFVSLPWGMHYMTHKLHFMPLQHIFLYINLK